MKLLIATHNAHKLAEIRAVLNMSGVEIIGMDEFPDVPEVVEDGDTFAANAIKKAVEVAKATGLRTMADDSGLEVDALDGAPGIYSARYAGAPSNDVANNCKLLSALEGIANRAARFRCVIAVAEPDGSAKTVDGCCEGQIGRELKGENGFGYDPLFTPVGYNKTFAELGDEIKNKISHRAMALSAVSDCLGRRPPSPLSGRSHTRTITRMTNKKNNPGCVQVYTGDGKGKTTSAAGLALRAIGAGMQVYIGQFIKGRDSSEMKILRERCSEVDIEQYGEGRFIKGKPSDDDIVKAHHGIEKLRKALTSGKYDMVIADEANGALGAGIISKPELLSLLDARPSGIELIITGRNAPPELIERADLVTEMKCIKHYYDAGIPARDGIEM